jgi:hypothetical protein
VRRPWWLGQSRLHRLCGYRRASGCALCVLGTRPHGST